VGSKTNLAWLNVIKDRVMMNPHLPRGSTKSLPHLYKDGSAKRNFFDAKMAIVVRAEKFIDAPTGELADKRSRDNDPVKSKDQLIHRWFQMLEGGYPIRGGAQRARIREGEHVSGAQVHVRNDETHAKAAIF
jgi:hypothetical protein